MKRTIALLFVLLGIAPAVFGEEQPFYETGGLWMTRRLVNRPAKAVGAQLRTALAPAASCGIRRVYVKFTPMAKDGKLPRYNAKNTQANIAIIREVLPGAKVYAWVGGVAGKHVNTSDAKLRDAFVADSAKAVEELGFDGVQLDIELVESGDASLLAYLKALRKSIGDEKILSVAVFPPPAAPKADMRRHYDAAYQKAIGALVDEVVVMAYDEALKPNKQGKPPIAELRAEYVKRVTAWTKAVLAAAGKAKVLVGVPTHAETRLHHPQVENVSSGAEGVLAALGEPEAVPQNFGGIAVFSLETATAKDWEALQKAWYAAAKKKYGPK